MINKTKLITLCFLLMLISCEQPEEVVENIIPQNVIPGSSNEIIFESDESGENTTVYVQADIQILIDRDYSPYEIINLNIDDDEDEEQIILAGPINDNDDTFKIYVADFDVETKTYKEIYSSSVSSKNLNIAYITSDDITGDHKPEIIINGIDTSDMQVFEVYKMIKKSDELSFNFSRIFSTVVDGDCEVLSIDRGNDYKVDGLTGESFQIEVQKKNPESTSTLIQELYKWNESKALYELSHTDKIKLSSVYNDNLVKFYRGSSSDYLDFLSGPWYKVKDLKGNPTHNLDEVFHLLGDDQIMTFYSGDLQETFTWADDKQPVKFRNALSFYDVRNNLLPSLYYSVTIYIDSLESIRIRIGRNHRWGGTYTQLTENLQNVLTDTSKDNSLLSKLELKGLYKSNLNSEIVFDNPEYILKDDSVESKGVYTIFTLGDDQILEMKELSSNGLALSVKTYRLDFTEESNDLRIIRTITLVEGTLQSSGIVLESNSELHFEQIEKINQEVVDG